MPSHITRHVRPVTRTETFLWSQVWDNMALSGAGCAEGIANHRLRGSGSTVVTMTSKVNGKTEISTPCRSETPENIETKIGVNDYVMDPYNHANFCGNRSKGVCSPYWWNITYLWLCVPSLSFPSLPFFFLSSPTAKTGGRIFTMYTLNDADSPKDVPFGGLDDEK